MFIYILALLLLQQLLFLAKLCLVNKVYLLCGPEGGEKKEKKKKGRPTTV